jgi:hypothetical protein
VSYRSTLSGDRLAIYELWFELPAKDLSWQLQRSYHLPQFVSEAIVEKITASEQWLRTQTTMLEAANKRIAWLESKVDPELLKPTVRETVSCTPPADSSD